jgi:nucleoside-diphosphate-sugar epimerase
MFGLVDVRDVSLAHLRALERKDAANERILLCSESMWCRDIGI